VTSCRKPELSRLESPRRNGGGSLTNANPNTSAHAQHLANTVLSAFLQATQLHLDRFFSHSCWGQVATARKASQARRVNPASAGAIMV